MIALDNLSVSFRGLRVVHDVSFAVAKGESFALVGESGSGKSTILKAIAGQAPEWTGQITVDGKLLSGHRTQGFMRMVQMVFQDPYGSLHPRRSVDDTLSEPLAVHRIGGRDRRVLDMLDAVGLSRRFRFRLPHQLSGGQRQRVAIARALMLEPQILLLDEPTSALDVSVQAEVLNLLAELRRARGLTYLLVTHDLPIVSFLCDRVGVLRHGKLQEISGVNALRAGKLSSTYGQDLVAHSRGMEHIADPLN